VQLIGTLHCTPEAKLKPKPFEFTPKTVITDVFFMQVYWKAAPKTWPGGSKASVAKCDGYPGTLRTPEYFRALHRIIPE